MAILILSPICPLTPWGLGPDGRWWKPPQGFLRSFPWLSLRWGRPPPILLRVAATSEPSPTTTG